MPPAKSRTAVPAVQVRSASVAELDPLTLYRILQLRVDVFVVEQECAYRELDGRDLEPSAVLVWAERDGEVVATLRLLRDHDGRTRIGRVATSALNRHDGIAGLLMRHALELAGANTVVLDAQSHLAHWYARFGFERSGADFVEDDIPHTPMRRAPR